MILRGSVERYDRRLPPSTAATEKEKENTASSSACSRPRDELCPLQTVVAPVHPTREGSRCLLLVFVVRRYNLSKEDRVLISLPTSDEFHRLLLNIREHG